MPTTNDGHTEHSKAATYHPQARDPHDFVRAHVGDTVAVKESGSSKEGYYVKGSSGGHDTYTRVK